MGNNIAQFIILIIMTCDYKVLGDLMSSGDISSIT